MNISKEDYLKTIYELGGEHSQVSNKDIAKVLSISSPSVTEMVKKLLMEGYIDYSAYQGIKLTKIGADFARNIRKRHLLWEIFLVEKLGYDWNEVHEEAEKLEHATSKKLEERLDRFLNYPMVWSDGRTINGGIENK